MIAVPAGHGANNSACAATTHKARPPSNRSQINCPATPFQDRLDTPTYPDEELPPRTAVRRDHHEPSRGRRRLPTQRPRPRPRRKRHHRLRRVQLARLEEDEPIVGHPRDPFICIDIRRSSRHIRLELHGIVVADSTRPQLLFESTFLPDGALLPATRGRTRAADPRNRAHHLRLQKVPPPLPRPRRRDRRGKHRTELPRPAARRRAGPRPRRVPPRNDWTCSWTAKPDCPGASWKPYRQCVCMPPEAPWTQPAGSA